MWSPACLPTEVPVPVSEELPECARVLHNFCVPVR